MNTRSLVLGILALIFLAGCKTTFKSGWTNFNAYYNTYYNAQQSYESGLNQNLNQPRDYNPLQPIRVHPKPVNAGAQDFEKAIQKGADILRRYEDSKWVDNAIGLIGKSYYYRQEYFSADQKFKELFVTTQDEELQQESILWQGRVLLDMELYNEGVAFLSEQLTLQDEIWSDSRKAEAKLLLAQHHVQLENWQTAESELAEALPNLKSKEYRERGYFLLGQIQERTGNTEDAFNAYDEVQNHYVEYRIQYLAQRKKAEVARELGWSDVAYRIFDDMVRDDKNLDYKSELDFELARTQHDRGEFDRAIESYKNVLRNRLSNPSPEIAARSYYGLAEINRFYLNDFSKAAAYYDSAAQRNVSADKLPEDFRARELAESFGNYASIKSEIALQDSLLTLGQMKQQEFDSALVKLKEQKLEELRELEEERQDQQNQMVAMDEEKSQDATSLTNGFLNSNNLALQANSRQQFMALWEGRPLADNWRVEELIDYSSLEEEDEEALAADGDEQSELAQVRIDLSRIPFEPQEQDSVRKRIAASQYEMGNLLFLSLEMPDSAIHYFKLAIENPSSDNVNMVSLYSLSELYASQGEQDEALEYAKRLVDEYPNSNYASRVAETYGLESPVQDLSSIDIIEVYHALSPMDSVSTVVKADTLRSFALRNKEHQIAPQALYDAIRAYMEIGKEQETYQTKLDAWVNSRSRWDERQDEFQSLKDSLQQALNDTTLALSAEDSTSYRAVVDSTLEEPDFSENFPYQGAYWDSARSTIDIFLEEFRDSKLSPKVERMNNELSLPEGETEDELTEGPAPAEAPEAEAVEGGYLSCQELGETLEIRGGARAFLDQITLPDELEIEEITFLFRVNQRGIVDEYELLTEETPEELIATFDNAFSDGFSFEPILSDGQAVAVQCEITFPLRN